MDNNLKKDLIALTKKYKINQNDNFLIEKDNKTYLCKMLSSDSKVSFDIEDINENNVISNLSEVNIGVNSFLERFSTIGYRNRNMLSNDETLSPRLSVIYRKNSSKIRVHKLSEGQSLVAENVMGYINQELSQKKKATITIRTETPHI